ncbi:apoptosis inducing factor mitochondria associated 4 isoform X2 [Polyodon spathula]|uniref:apoptosis inducing factor mitochondria associated 4 isoform X2 n=1 Tax=Polyodon spathula TaxID=7913 RepID=UPI001B7DFFA8|nr:apoptosis inducing factor mitochondria associated 4 isoform X2 [Polyodon spathula]
MAALNPAKEGGQEEEITGMVCLESDLKEGEMREVEVGNHKVLLVRSEGGYSAVGSLCTHYGASLSKGALSGSRVRCPWHGACFNIKTGDIEEYPGLDGLPCHKVKIENSKVFVSINKKDLEKTRRVKEMGCRVAGDSSTVLIIGGGPAALVCAETLRQGSYGGRIIMATKEELPPYDRTKLSKAMNVKADGILLRQLDFYQSCDIEVWLRKEAVSVNTDEKTVTFQDGSVQQYDQLLIATGSRPREVACPGADLDNVALLRTPDDSSRIHQAALGKNVVILGTSFIGMEVASYLSDTASSVSVIGNSAVPYQNTLGTEIGRVARKMLEEKNVKFYMQDGVTELRGENGKVKQVVLKSGKILPADVFVTGIGVQPNSAFLEGSSVALGSTGAVIVDKFMQTNVPGVFAAGDVTSFPLSLRKDKMVNIGHWQLAHAHGRIAALNMLKKRVGINSVPFFWTMLMGKSFRYAGYGEGYTEVIMKGKVEEMKFLAFYIKDDVVVAVASLNFDPSVSQVAEIMASGRTISKAQAKSDDMSWLKLP